jgi:hypothetical protein
MKKSLIGLNAYNSKTKINNANWENHTREEVYINDGDTVALKASFIDTRNRVTGNINIDQDTTIELSYMFYYINRGGTPNKSLNPTTLFPNRQQTAMEYFNNGSEQPAVGSDTAPTPSLPAGTTGITIPIEQDTDKTTANLAPLVESIYHCYTDEAIPNWYDPSSFPLVNFSSLIVGEQYQINSLGSISNELWIEAGSPNPPVIGDIFTCIASPGNEVNFPIINVIRGKINKTYKIISLGDDDTEWSSVNTALDNPAIGNIFDYDSPYASTPITDGALLLEGKEYNIQTCYGYDFSSMGGPSLPMNTNKPVDLNRKAQQGGWFQFTSLTPKLTDGISLIDYSPYIGPVTPTLGFQFLSLEDAQNVPNRVIPTDKNGIYIINTGTKIQVTEQGLINWSLIGYSFSPSTPTINISGIKPNIYYEVMSNNAFFGVNNQFPQITIPNFIVGNIIKLPAPTDTRVITQNENGTFTQTGTISETYTPPVNNFSVIDPITLTSDYNGEYFIIINNNVIDASLWETMFVSTFGTGGADDWDDGMVIQAKGINATPMPNWTAGVQIQWLSFMGIPVGSSITVEDMGPIVGNYYWEMMGNTNTNSFVTKSQVPVEALNNPDFAQGQIEGSFTFTNSDATIRDYTIQVPSFSFITTTTYPTNLKSTDTSWIAYLIPTDEILEILNYDLPFTFTTTSAGTTSSLTGAYIYSSLVPTGTIQENYDEGDVYLYDRSKMDTIKANNVVGFSNTIDAGNPDGLPYLLNYCIPKNVDGSNTFDPELLEATSIKPFIKKWKMVIKKGTYTPDYMAEILTRGMSTQRQKLQTTSGANQTRYLGTPIQGINSQLYGTSDFSYIRNGVTTATTEDNFVIKASQVGPYYGFIPPNNEQGAFPSKNQYPPDFTNLTPNDPLPTTIDSKQFDPAREFQPNKIGKNYQPNLMYNAKNKNILPGYDGNQTSLPNTLPVNPRYTALDFNNPDSNIQDDNPFIYRPNAFTQRDINNPSRAKVRLSYNDYNLSNFNNINPFGDVADENIKNIEMFYKPLCNDMNSSYFVKTQYDNDLTITNDYAIKPVISVPVAQLPIPDLNPTVPSGELNVGVAYSAPIEISTPLVGAPLMSVMYNQENNGLFEFGYMHTPIYAKLDATSDQIEECVGMYPSVINGNPNNKASGEPLFYYGADTVLNHPGLADAAPYLRNGRIGWVEQLSTITSTMMYGYAIADTEIFFKDLIFIYDETKPRTEYVFQNTHFYLQFIADYPPVEYSIPVGNHLVIKGSLLNGIDVTNDLVIEVVKTDDNGTITEFTYTGTPSENYYSEIKKSLTPLSSVIQIAQQSGIILYDMKATKADGTITPFWENLGFSVNDITYKADTPLSYEKFLSLTTRGLLSTSNVFDPDTVASGTTEQSYIPYTDSLNMLGWYKPSTAGTFYDGVNEPDIADWVQKYFPNLYSIFRNLSPGNLPILFMPSAQAVGNFELQNKILYSVVESTIPISAKSGFSDSTDAGHYLISIEGFGGTYLLTDIDKLNVKSLVSTYYTGPNAFVSNSLADSALYEHIGEPMKIQNFKVRILSAYTGEEVENLGPNSSIYLEITKTLNKNNITNLTSTN